VRGDWKIGQGCSWAVCDVPLLDEWPGRALVRGRFRCCDGGIFRSRRGALAVVQQDVLGRLVEPILEEGSWSDSSLEQAGGPWFPELFFEQAWGPAFVGFLVWTDGA
jgi:hypothetical protein